MLFGVLTAEGILTAVAATAGLPGLSPLPIWQTMCALAYSFVFSLDVNDWVKNELAKRQGLSW